MAGVAGFEPAHGDTKNRCLTAWLHPSTPRHRSDGLGRRALISGLFYRLQEVARTRSFRGAAIGRLTPDPNLRTPKAMALDQTVKLARIANAKTDAAVRRCAPKFA